MSTRADNLVPQSSAVLNTQRNSSIGSATAITLNSATRLIEVHAENSGIYIAFTGTVTSSNGGYQAYVQAGQTRHYPVDARTTLSVLQSGTSGVITVIEYATS